MHYPQLIRTVSIHAPAWGATSRNAYDATTCGVSIHAPAWGATNIVNASSSGARFQFTLPRGERPGALLGPRETRGVSIHAPAWGATDLSRASRMAFNVSIHAPAWGATEDNTANRLQVKVSIHAPAWGATGFQPQGSHDTRRFNSRSRVGSDAADSKVISPTEEFQFTLPRGERPIPFVINQGVRTFQFTLPRGERHAILFGVDFDDRVSIHAPAWGATHHYRG